MGLKAHRPLLKLLKDDSEGTAPRRRVAARLLGQLEGAKFVVDALVLALQKDADAKTRKNAAASLGRLGVAPQILVELLKDEEIGWVRAAIILALGRQGQEEALEPLRAHEAQTPEEAQALERAIERLEPHQSRVSWQPDRTWPGPVLLEVPVGLEDVALDEARKAQCVASRLGKRRPGLLKLGAKAAPSAVWPGLRCVYRMRLMLTDGPGLLATDPQAPAAVVAWMGTQSGLKELHAWLDAPEGVALKYRFDVRGKGIRRKTRAAWLEAVRTALAPLGLKDSPSSYDFELVLEPGAKLSRAWIVPSFAGDERFAYRHRDVGASIHPVVGAALARLVFTGPQAEVRDPTCGSATLLIERAMLGAGALSGSDVSPTAVAASQTNIAASGQRITIHRGDAAEPSSWAMCDEVLANLPFGLRTARRDVTLTRLYNRLSTHLGHNLRAKGRALLYTTARGALDDALGRNSRLTIQERRVVEAGGLEVGLWLVGRSGRRA